GGCHWPPGAASPPARRDGHGDRGRRSSGRGVGDGRRRRSCAGPVPVRGVGRGHRVRDRATPYRSHLGRAALCRRLRRAPRAARATEVVITTPAGTTTHPVPGG